MRGNNTCTEKYFNKELKLIKQLAVNNGYKVEMVENILKTTLRKFANSEVFQNLSFKSLAYFGNYSVKLASLLTK